MVAQSETIKAWCEFRNKWFFLGNQWLPVHIQEELIRYHWCHTSSSNQIDHVHVILENAKRMIRVSQALYLCLFLIICQFCSIPCTESAHVLLSFILTITYQSIPHLGDIKNGDFISYLQYIFLPCQSKGLYLGGQSDIIDDGVGTILKLLSLHQRARFLPSDN